MNRGELKRTLAEVEQDRKRLAEQRRCVGMLAMSGGMVCLGMFGHHYDEPYLAILGWMLAGVMLLACMVHLYQAPFPIPDDPDDESMDDALRVQAAQQGLIDLARGQTRAGLESPLYNVAASMGGNRDDDAMRHFGAYRESLLERAEEGGAMESVSLASLLVGLGHGEAIVWIRKAALQGDSDGEYLLGLCYYAGRGVQVDGKEAVKWLCKAAEQGHTDAQALLGTWYCARGDFAEGYRWLNESIMRRNLDASQSLNTILRISTLEQIERGIRGMDEVASEMTSQEIAETRRRLAALQ